MRTFGIYLFIVGLLSIGLQFLNMNFIFLNWINKWGESTGWLIRGGICLIGILFWYFGKKSTDE